MQNKLLNSNSTNPKKLFSGPDHISFDIRPFNPSKNDIEELCLFFSIGKLKCFQKEKDIIISHSNFFIFVETTSGQYALKFYPIQHNQILMFEHTINRLLLTHHFSTPKMYVGKNGKPFLISNNRLASCFSYIKSQQAWTEINQKNIIKKINTEMFTLKKILKLHLKTVPFRKAENLMSKITNLTKKSQTLGTYDQKKLITASLKAVCQTYQHNLSLFSRQHIHNNSNLANFLISKETIYTLDLSHICEDYSLSDLSSLITSCLLLSVPKKTIRTLVHDYFIQHKIPLELPVLDTLIQIELIQKFLLCLHRLKSIDFSAYEKNFADSYQSYLSNHMLLISRLLQPQSLNYLT